MVSHASLYRFVVPLSMLRPWLIGWQRHLDLKPRQVEHKGRCLSLHHDRDRLERTFDGH
jgi:hypothetical protein